MCSEVRSIWQLQFLSSNLASAVEERLAQPQASRRNTSRFDGVGVSRLIFHGSLQVFDRAHKVVLLLQSLPHHGQRWVDTSGYGRFVTFVDRRPVARRLHTARHRVIAHSSIPRRTGVRIRSKRTGEVQKFGVTEALQFELWWCNTSMWSWVPSSKPEPCRAISTAPASARHCMLK